MQTTNIGCGFVKLLNNTMKKKLYKPLGGDKLRKVTIKDVAKLAGVSTAAVSYVLNNVEGKVSEETIEKIQNAIKELNYIPNFSAISLVKNRSKLISVIIPQTEESKQLILENPFYSEIVSGIELKVREMGYHMILSGVDKGNTYLDVTTQRNIDGAIIMGAYHESFYDEVKKAKIPIVLIDSYINDNDFYNIGIDDEHGGYIGTKYLIDSGHKNIALVTGTIREDGVVEKRFLGYKRALKEANIFYKSQYIFEDSVSYEYGYEAGKIIAKSYPEITAVNTTADIIAFGVVRGIKESGRKVPEDISVIGFDDVYFSKMFIPRLTTVKQNIFNKGLKAAEVLINVIDGRMDVENKDISLETEIVERQTIKKLI